MGKNIGAESCSDISLPDEYKPGTCVAMQNLN